MFAGSIVSRLMGAHAPVAALLAPAGYGKSHISRLVAAQYAQAIVTDCASPATAPDARAALESFASAPGACLVFENLHALDDAAARELLAAALEARPKNARIVLCSRRDSLDRIAEGVDPHVIVTLRKPDLSFPYRRIGEMFAGLRVTDKTLWRVNQITQGWPEALLFFRGMIEQELAPADRGGWDVVDLTDFFRYIRARVIDGLSEALLRGLFLYTGIGGEADDPTHSFGSREQRPGGTFDALCRELQLVDAKRDGTVSVPPLLRLFVASQFPREFRQAVLERSRELEQEGEFRYAIRGYLALGDLDRADRVARQHHDAVALDRVLPETSFEGGKPDAASYLLYPRLWTLLLPTRSFLEPTEVLAREAVDVFASAVDPATRLMSGCAASVLAFRSGDVPGGLAFARWMADVPETPRPLDGALRALPAVFAHMSEGRYAEAAAAWHDLQRAVLDMFSWRAVLIPIGLRIQFALGNVERIDDELSRLRALARLTGSPILAAVAAGEEAYAAWFRNETGALNAAVDAFAEALRRVDAPMLWSLAGALLGQDLFFESTQDPYHDARALLVSAVDARDPAAGIRYARACVLQADACNCPVLRGIARIVASVRIASEADALLDAAERIAAETDSEMLRQAIRAARGGRGGSPLDGVLARLEAALRSVPAESERTYVWVSDGTIVRGDQKVAVSDGTMALLVCLAIARGAIPREVLIDRLWPHLDANAAASSLKMCVHRARQQVGDPNVVVFARGSYALGPNVATDYAGMGANPGTDVTLPLRESERASLRTTFEHMKAGGCGRWAQWEWLQPFLHNIEENARRVGNLLAADAVSRNDYASALAIARGLKEIDPLDEIPRRIAIGAYLAMQNKPRAIQEYDEYRKILESELGIAPSAQLTALLR